MIIKKKYTSIKKLIDQAPEQDTLSIINDAVQSYEEAPVQDFEQPAQEEGFEIQSDGQADEAVLEEEEKRRTDIDDLDLTLENITFAPREERREGTRRRGYRRSQDRNIVTRAQQEALTIRDAAKQSGYEEGIKQAQQDLQEIKKMLAGFFDCRQEVYDKVSECIYDIAVQAAKKIIQNEVNENREYIIGFIKSLAEDIDKTESRITLKVMPKDAQITRDKINDIFDTQYFHAKITVVPDNSIQDGGVIIETSNGIIDASITSRLAIIEQALKKPEEKQ